MVIGESLLHGDQPKDRPWRQDEVLLVAGLLLLTLGARLFLSGAGTLPGDMDYWIRWGNQLSSAPLNTFYARTDADYLPIYPYILLAITRLYDPVSSAFAAGGYPIPHDTLYKLPAILADVATVFLLYSAARTLASPLTAGLVASVYAVNPAIIANSARWGQVDSIPACLMILAVVLFLKQRPALCGGVLALSVLTKPTALVLLPLIAVFWLRRGRVGSLLVLLASFGVTAMVVIWPFIPAGIDVLQFVKQRFLVTTSTWSFATMNAFNFWALHQNNVLKVPDSSIWMGLSEHTWGWLFMAGFEAAACALLLLNCDDTMRARARLYLPAAVVVVYAFFVVLTRIHERHLLPALPLVALTCAIAPEFWPVYLWLSAAYLLNLHFSAPGIFAMPEPLLGRSEVPLISGTNVVALVIALILAVRRCLETARAAPD